MGYSVYRRLESANIGDVRTIKYERNPKGKEIAIVKAAQKLGRYYEIHQDVENKIFIARRVK